MKILGKQMELEMNILNNSNQVRKIPDLLSSIILKIWSWDSISSDINVALMFL